ncbi:fibronectin type III domain-containing protein [Streptomyces sp. NBC_00637]|uniref:fibronectin type III domain-containing protein n=1 Tax=Streptomyces sp. NBC_00637 TaxID=2903667 RepID=UPI003252291F
MKLGRSLAVAVLLTPVALVGIAQPAAASTPHTVTVKGSMRLVDTGEFGSSEETFHFNRSVQLTHQDKRKVITVVNCHGGEVKGVFDVLAQLDESDTMWVWEQARLFEGDSCDTKDLDAREDSGGNQPLQLGESTRKGDFFYLVNPEFISPDLMDVSFTVSHDGPPRSPERVSAKRVLNSISLKRVVAVEWKDASSNEKAFEVRYNNTGEIRRADPNTTRFTWGGLSTKERQCFSVRAVNDFGVSSWIPGTGGLWLPMCVGKNVS